MAENMTRGLKIVGCVHFISHNVHTQKNTCAIRGHVSGHELHKYFFIYFYNNYLQYIYKSAITSAKVRQP